MIFNNTVLSLEEHGVDPLCLHLHQTSLSEVAQAPGVWLLPLSNGDACRLHVGILHT